MPKIKINDINMYYEIHGKGEPLIFVSGFSADHLSWTPLLAEFSGEYQVVLFNNRGVGQTDAPSGKYSIEQMAKDIADLCHALNITSAHFVGNSMGGFLVQMLAFQYPSLTKSIVISNSGMTINTPFHFFVAAQLELMKANAPKESLIKTMCPWAFSFQFLSQSGKFDELIKWGMDNPYPFTIAGYEGQYAALDSFDSTSWANKIKAPTLVITADQDIILRSEFSKQLSSEIFGAQYYCFENCGHVPHLEYPKQYAEIVKSFLKTIH